MFLNSQELAKLTDYRRTIKKSTRFHRVLPLNRSLVAIQFRVRNEKREKMNKRTVNGNEKKKRKEYYYIVILNAADT